MAGARATQEVDVAGRCVELFRVLKGKRARLLMLDIYSIGAWCC
jgi:hypothetical protein